MPYVRVNLGSVKLRKLAHSRTADNLDAAFTKVDDAIEALQADVAALGGGVDLTALQTAVDDLEARVTAIETAPAAAAVWG